MSAAGSPELAQTTLRIEQQSLGGGKHAIQLTLETRQEGVTPTHFTFCT